jgi:hypothetical protein
LFTSPTKGRPSFFMAPATVSAALTQLSSFVTSMIRPLKLPPRDSTISASLALRTPA